MNETICPICGLKYTQQIDYPNFGNVCPHHTDTKWRNIYAELQIQRDTLAKQNNNLFLTNEEVCNKLGKAIEALRYCSHYHLSSLVMKKAQEALKEII